MKNSLPAITQHLSNWMEITAGVALIGVMLLIGADIIGRMFGFPVPGTYELVSLAGGLIIGLALPATSIARGHVSTDILLGRISKKNRQRLIVVTRLIGIGIFLLAGYGMIMMGLRLKESGEVTAVLALPLYYATYAVGGAFLIQSLVLFTEMIQAINPDYS